MMQYCFRRGGLVLLLVSLAVRALARVVPEESTAALEGTEDVRLLFCQGANRVHELDALIQYGRGFGLSDLREEEPREWHREFLRLFEPLKSTDDAGQALQAWVDSRRHDVDITEDLDHLRALQGECARQTLELYRRLGDRIAAVRALVAGSSRRLRVCTSCLQAGKVIKAV